MTRYLTINGIRTDGSGSTDKVKNELKDRGFNALDINYPRVSIFTARSRKRQLKNASILYRQSRKGDNLIAHSYGCLLALRAMELGAQFNTVFLIAPAMNVDFTFPYLGANKIIVIHNEKDQAIKLGQILWWHDFGAMGRKGYQGPPDPRVINVEDKGKGGNNHSHYFRDDNIESWTDFIIQNT